MKQIWILLAIGLAILPNILLAQAGNLKIEPRNCFAEVDIVIVNDCKVRISIENGPFAGLSLKADQTSSRPKKVCTGPISFALQLNEQDDTSATGRQFNYALVAKILAEGDTVLHITDRDLEPVGVGERIEKILQNPTGNPYDVISENNVGKMVPANSRGTKLACHKGWNRFVFQYKDEFGLPAQAVVLFLTDKNKTPLVIHLSDKKRSPLNPIGLSIDDWDEEKDGKK